MFAFDVLSSSVQALSSRARSYLFMLVVLAQPPAEQQAGFICTHIGLGRSQAGVGLTRRLSHDA